VRSGSSTDQTAHVLRGTPADYDDRAILGNDQCGSVSVLSGAPYGCRYIRKDEGGGAARYEIVLDVTRGPPGF
jgi:hypothetical protein